MSDTYEKRPMVPDIYSLRLIISRLLFIKVLILNPSIKKKILLFLPLFLKVKRLNYHEQITVQKSQNFIRI